MGCSQNYGPLSVTGFFFLITARNNQMFQNGTLIFEATLMITGKSVDIPVSTADAHLDILRHRRAWRFPSTKGP